MPEFGITVCESCILCMTDTNAELSWTTFMGPMELDEMRWLISVKLMTNVTGIVYASILYDYSEMKYTAFTVVDKYWLICY